MAPAFLIAILAMVGWRAALIDREPWKQPVSRTVDLNTATKAELRLLPGIGPALAERIEQDRAERGGFASVDDLTRVRGIGPRTVIEIRPFARVGDE